MRCSGHATDELIVIAQFWHTQLENKLYIYDIATLMTWQLDPNT